MDRMIAYCGLICTDCEAYLATQADDRAALERVAARWREVYHAPHITVESVLCDGCVTESQRKCGHWHECEIRICAMERGVVNCAHCADYACEKLTDFFGFVPEARTVLDGVRARLDWLLDADEPWTRYRTLRDLLGRPGDDPEVRAARDAMLAHPQVQALAARAAAWGQQPFKRHNDAAYPIYALSTLADFGLRADDDLPGLETGMAAIVDAVLAHQAPEGAFQTLVNIPRSFGGSGEDAWTWMACDAPTLLYILLAMGRGDDPRVQRAVEHLAGLVDENGWRCVVAPELGKFRGPGRKADPCPIANVYALKALSLVPEMVDSPATRTGAEMLLWHWENQKGRKIYQFGIGTTFRRLKYPFVWYDILHVVEVLSRFPFVHGDPRFREMVETLTAQADEDGRYTAGSMYRAWKGWSFADKKHPSPWLTFLVLRMTGRLI